MTSPSPALIQVPMNTLPKTIAVAGATGFVGSALIQQLLGRCRIIALSRSHPPGLDDDGVEWRRCDLYSLLDAERALEGVDQAIYLVHSMLPSAQLTQGDFADTDLILADNFARAAHLNGLKQLLYLGGIVPRGRGAGALSKHLRSRLEVEEALTLHPTPVTSLRAGLIVGPDGSSLTILLKLIKRLPLMVTPKWTSTPTHPIALGDVLEIILHCLTHPSVEDRHLDIGGPEVMSYREMMTRTATVLGRDPIIVSVPVITPRLSRLWVSLVTGQPKELVGPLIESLTHPMVAKERLIQGEIGQTPLGFEASLKIALAGEIWPEGQAPTLPPPHPDFTSPEAALDVPLPLPPQSEERDVRSVQRLPLPKGRDAKWVAEEYMRWLPDALSPVLKVKGAVEPTGEADEEVVSFHLWPLKAALLKLTYAPKRSTPDRALFYITGGILAVVDPSNQRRGRLEFRTVLDREAALAAIHDFVPRLPWVIYNLSQALVHLWVMWRFGRHLGRVSEGEDGGAIPALNQGPSNGPINDPNP